jgi:hypothetical protein
MNDFSGWSTRSDLRPGRIEESRVGEYPKIPYHSQEFPYMNSLLPHMHGGLR